MVVRQRSCKRAQNPTQIYQTNDTQGDQRLLHDSGRTVDPDYLSKLGVLFFHLPNEEEVDTIARERSYKNRDVIIVSPEKMGDIYEEKVKSFFHEHLHEDEEIRYIRDGAGFFDVRSEDDEWVRIYLEKDDMIVGSRWQDDWMWADVGQVLPAGIYHRFTTDSNNVS